MKPVYLILFLGFLLLAGASKVNAQIVIQSDPQLDAMVERIVGDRHYDNVTYQGANIAKALFDNGNSTNLGLDKGIVLCTGDTYYIPGPNNHCFGFITWNNPGYPLLDAIVNYGQTFDAAVLDFDVIPETDTLKFTYVFGSEEYNQDSWFFSDVFGCFITGPIPGGGVYNHNNIALLPDTNNTTIQVDNINNGDFPCGIIPTGPCTNCQYYWDNTNGLTLEYDGFTVVLEAWAEVVPCASYHVTLAIADGGLMSWCDSGVFIKSSDYKSPKMEISIDPAPTDTIADLIEGCSEANIILKIPSLDYAPVIAYLDFSQGTVNPAAYPDGDFIQAIPDQVTFEEGEDSVAIHVAPAGDGIAEGNELLRIIVEYTLTCNPKYDTIDIVISDYTEMVTQTSPNTTLCIGDEVTLWVSAINGIPPYNYQWQGTTSTSDTITVNPTSSTWNYVTVTDQCQDTVTDSIYVNVVNMAIPVFLGNDTTICADDEITLQPQQAIYNSYYWSTGDTTSSITVSQPGTYSLDVTSQCGESSDEIVIDQWAYPDPGLGPDLQLCFGETAFLQATTGFDSYTWQDNSTDDFFIVTQGGLYFVNVEDIHGCVGSDSVIVLQGNNVQLQADSLDLCIGDSINIQANPGFYTYTWSTGQTGTDNITVDEGGWYKVDVAYVYGCPSKDSLFVDEFPKPEAKITGEDMFCEGDAAWLYAPEGKYDYSWNDEPGTSAYLVTESGNYILKLSNVCGESTDEKFVQMNALPAVDLGEDIILMPGESVKLDAGNHPSVIWNHDSTQTGQYLTISYDDLTNQIDSVFVEVFDGFCKNSDNIVIELFDIEVPIVITPNGDGRNDLFKPGEGWVGSFSHHITVFNRWGQPVWESDDFASGWNGKQNGKTVADGTYYWILEIYLDSKKIKKTYKGSLTVVGGGG